MLAVYHALSQVIEKIACVACGSTSWFSCYQPEEPKEIKTLLKR